jgi:HlyD family secretion protein
VTAAAAAIEVAKANLTSTAADLEKTVIYAPISGIVLSRNVEPGQTVAASLQAPVLFVLAEDLRRMELQVDVDEADVGQVKEGQTATFTVDAYPERTFEARITQVRYGAETTDGVVTYKTVLSVANPDLLLRPGMTATADITVLNIEKALLVPNTALRFTPAVSAAGDKETRSLLDSLLPGPRRRQRAKRSAETGTPAPKAEQARVWILRENRPVPVAVEKVATDGALTAVTSADLHIGEDLILNAITTRK